MTRPIEEIMADVDEDKYDSSTMSVEAARALVKEAYESGVVDPVHLSPMTEHKEEVCEVLGSADWLVGIIRKGRRQEEGYVSMVTHKRLDRLEDDVRDVLNKLAR